MFRWILAAIAVPVLNVAIWLAYSALPIHGPQPPVGHEARQRADQSGYERVPLVRLLVTPERYDGRKVQVEGFLTLEYEGDAVHLDKAASDAGLRSNSIWLDRPQWLTQRDERKLHRKYVVAEGTFSASKRGHLGLYSGTLTELHRIRTSFTRADYAQVRLSWSRQALLESVIGPWLLTWVGWASLAIYGFIRRRER